MNVHENRVLSCKMSFKSELFPQFGVDHGLYSEPEREEGVVERIGLYQTIFESLLLVMAA